MAENSPFLNQTNTPTATTPEAEATPKADTLPPRSPFSLRPAAGIAPAPSGTEAAGAENASQVSSSRPQVIPGPAIGESPKRSAATPTYAEAEVRQARKKRFLLGFVSLVILILIGGGIYWWWQTPAQTPEAPAPDAQVTPAPSTTLPSITPPETEPVILEDTAAYRSENFKAGDIIFLGEAQFLQTDEGIAPLSLENIRGEAFTEKNKQEVKLVITWKTNKLSSAEISYAKGIGQTPKIATEEDLAYNHSLILTGLDPASTYLYTVKATDRFGTVVTSEPYAVFTGARSVSLFDLIAGAIGDVFGWAVK